MYVHIYIDRATVEGSLKCGVPRGLDLNPGPLTAMYRPAPLGCQMKRLDWAGRLSGRAYDLL